MRVMHDRKELTSHRCSPCHGSVLLALVCGLVLALGSGVAQAAVSYGETGSFGEVGAGAGQFDGPAGVAVDQSNGDVYVADAGRARVQKLGPKGEFILMFGKEVNETKVEQGEPAEASVCTEAEIEAAGVTCKAGVPGSEAGEFGQGELALFGTTFGPGSAGAAGVAVDPATGDVYVADPWNKRIEKFSSTGTYLSEITGTPAGGFSERNRESTGVSGVAIDPLEDSTYGGHDVYVTDYGDNAVDVFNSAGTYLRQLTVANPDAAAFNSSGDVYVIAREERTVYRFAHGEGMGEPLSLEGGLAGAEAIAVGAGGELLVLEHEGDSTGHMVAFGPTGTRLTGFGEGQFAENLSRGGVAVNLATMATYFSGGGTAFSPETAKVWIFEKEEGSPPTAQTLPATENTATTATLNGMVNPEGQASEFWFEYGLTEAYGSEAPVPHGSAGAGSTETAVTAHVEELQPHATYHYRLSAKNVFGTTEASGAKELTTPSDAPVVSDEQSPLSVITQTGAEVGAQVNPNNEVTHWHVEYSTSPSLSGATSLPAVEAEIPAGYGEVPINQLLGPLSLNTTYYWRAVASNSGGGVRKGAIESLLTRPATPATGEASGITQTEASVTGTFNPGGHDTHAYFEYGTAVCTPTSCGSSTTEIDAGSGTNPVEPTARLSALQPLRTYHYRLVVTNTSGPSYGPEGEVTTLALAPIALADPPTNVSPNSATLTGSLNPQGVSGTYRFEYGPTTNYGTTSPETAVAAASTGVVVGADTAGLEPNTTYHYRLVVANNGGTTIVYSSDATFTTYAEGAANSAPPPLGFSLTGAAPAGSAPTVFADLSGLAPAAPAATTPVTKAPKSKPLTRAQKLSRALKACKKLAQRKRPACTKAATRRYAAPRGSKKRR
jgi:DNA-binding beta-propeller fold protein YncE